MLVGAIMILLIMFGGIVDLGMLFLYRARTQRLADAAALAGVRMCGDESAADALPRARTLAELNTLDIDDAGFVAGLEVVPTRECDKVNSQFFFGVRVSAPVRLMFASLWEAISGGTVTVSSEAEAARGTLDLMMVFDTSGFVQLPPAGWPWPPPPADPLGILAQIGRETVDTLFTGGHANRIGVVRYDTFGYTALPLSDNEGAVDGAIASLPVFVAAENEKRPFVFHDGPLGPTWRYQDNMHLRLTPAPGGCVFCWGWGFDFPCLTSATATATAELDAYDASVKAIIFFISSIPLQPGIDWVCSGPFCTGGRNPQTGVANNAQCRNAAYIPAGCRTSCTCGGVDVLGDIAEAVRIFSAHLTFHNTVYFYIVYSPSNALVADCELVPPLPGTPNNCSLFDFTDPGYVWGPSGNVRWFSPADLIQQYDEVLVPELDTMVDQGLIRGHYRAWDDEEMKALRDDLSQVVHSRLVG